MTRKENEAGFTLLELLVAITVLSLLLVALSAGVHFAGRAWRLQEDRIGRQGDIHAVQNVLRTMLASGEGFKGEPGDLKFVGRLPEALARGGLFDIELFSDGEALLLSWHPHFKGESAGLPQNEAKLMDGVAGLELSYFLEGQGWQKLTSDKSKALEIIAIKARLSDGRVWPQLMIAPAINVSSKAKS
jgi:general secretion pathway protein J